MLLAILMRTAFLVPLLILTTLVSPILGIPPTKNDLQPQRHSGATAANVPKNTSRKRNLLSFWKARPTLKDNTPEEKSDSTHFSSSLSSPEIHSLHLRPRIISLNIMVAGLAGLGKTTMCSALLDSLIETVQPNPKTPRSKTKTRSTVVIDESHQFEKHDLEANTILRVRIVDTPGFGNRINHKHSLRPITEHIERRRRYKYKKETSLTSIRDYMDSTEDELIHVCLYFLSPSRFLAIDRHFLKRIQRDVPTIVPVIAKADTLTDEEIGSYRAELTRIFEEEGIRIYDFDETDVDRTTTTTSFDRGRRPGEVLGIVARDGVYPWGESCAFDRRHSDLRLVRDLLLSQHTERFVESALVKYTEYRSRKIVRGRVMDVLKVMVLVVFLVLQIVGSDLVKRLDGVLGVVSNWMSGIVSDEAR